MKRQQLAAVSHVSAPGNAHMMQRLFANTDRSEEEDDDDGEDNLLLKNLLHLPFMFQQQTGDKLFRKGLQQTTDKCGERLVP
jgi:hypothetical protein